MAELIEQALMPVCALPAVPKANINFGCSLNVLCLGLCFSTLVAKFYFPDGCKVLSSALTFSFGQVMTALMQKKRKNSLVV